MKAGRLKPAVAIVLLFIVVGMLGPQVQADTTGASDLRLHGSRMGRFYAAVLMSSTRTKAWHSIRDENIREHRSGDGTLVVMTDGHEFDNNIIPTMNWYSPSGVTVARKVRVNPEHDGHSTVVGGLAHKELSAMAGMDFVIVDGDRKLEARKSYTATPIGLVLAGTRIRCPALDKGEAFHTSLHHCPLRDQDTSLVIDGKTIPLEDGSRTLTVKKWMHVRNYGYVFPVPTEIELRISASEKAYTYINRRYGAKTKHKARFYTLLRHHDIAKLDNEYAVVIIPDISLEKMRKLVNTPSLVLKVKTKNLHVVDDKRSRVRHMYFFEQHEAQGYSAAQPLFLSLSREGGELHITLQDPSHAGGEVTFDIPFAVSSQETGVAVAPAGKGSKVTVTLDGGWPRDVALAVR